MDGTTKRDGQRMTKRNKGITVLLDHGFSAIDTAVNRLADYEDTGLAPEEIEKLVCVKEKLDAAIEDIPHTCEYCAYNGVDMDAAPCADCERMNTLFGEERWEWRGLKEG